MKTFIIELFLIYNAIVRRIRKYTCLTLYNKTVFNNFHNTYVLTRTLSKCY